MEMSPAIPLFCDRRILLISASNDNCQNLQKTITWEVAMRKGEGIGEFVAVAETNSFTAAARRLELSAAYVSR